uniref:Uncharacterized protein n=1 Tax=Alexandrium catenella TaxID=2925 RepID=A0A7S1W2X9_ALECA
MVATPASPGEAAPPADVHRSPTLKSLRTSGRTIIVGIVPPLLDGGSGDNKLATPQGSPRLSPAMIEISTAGTPLELEEEPEEEMCIDDLKSKLHSKMTDALSLGQLEQVIADAIGKPDDKADKPEAKPDEGAAAKSTTDLEAEIGRLKAEVESLKKAEPPKAPEKTEPSAPKAKPAEKAGAGSSAALEAEIAKLKGKVESLEKDNEQLRKENTVLRESAAGGSALHAVRAVLKEAQTPDSKADSKVAAL